MLKYIHNISIKEICFPVVSLFLLIYILYFQADVVGQILLEHEKCGKVIAAICAGKGLKNTLNYI